MERKESIDNHSFGRRLVLRGGVAAGAAVASVSAFPVSAGASEATSDRDGRIDTHHHAVPPAMRKWLVDQGILPPQGGPRWASWSLTDTLRVLDANRIAVGVASAPAPDYLFTDQAMARDGVLVMNESIAELVKDHPRRFGHFAYISHRYVDLALDQISHAFDALGADGVLLMNTAGGRYLGDPMFEPILAELDRRSAVVFTHPDKLPGDSGGVPGVESWVADYMLDTTRNALSLLQAEALDRYPNISFILSHGGGFLPYAAGRAEMAGRLGDGPPAPVVRAGLRRFYYDTAMPTSPNATPTLLRACDPRRVLLGTDWPQAPAEEVGRTVIDFDRDPTLDPLTRQAIGRDNALRLLPTVRQRLSAG